MKRDKIVLRLSLMLFVVLGTLTAAGPSSSAKNRCKDRCKEDYNIKKDACKTIPLKHARKVCEDVAKRSRNECKRRCP